jgi:hypothetical protein
VFHILPFYTNYVLIITIIHWCTINTIDYNYAYTYMMNVISALFESKDLWICFFKCMKWSLRNNVFDQDRTDWFWRQLIRFDRNCSYRNCFIFNAVYKTICVQYYSIRTIMIDWFMIQDCKHVLSWIKRREFGVSSSPIDFFLKKRKRKTFGISGFGHK